MSAFKALKAGDLVRLHSGRMTGVVIGFIVIKGAQQQTVQVQWPGAAGWSVHDERDLQVVAPDAA